MPATTTKDLLGVLTDPAEPKAAVMLALSTAVLYPSDFPELQGLNGQGIQLFSSEQRQVRLVQLDADAAPLRHPTAHRLIYVLSGRVYYTTFDGPDGELRRTHAHIVGVGQLKDIPPALAHRMRPHSGDATVLLEVLLGDAAALEELPDPGEAPDDAADYYYEYDECYRTVYSAGADLWEMPEPNDALVLITQEAGFDMGQRWLDLGCGEGRDSLYLAKQGLDVTGVDVSRTALDKARSRAGAEGVDCMFLERDVTRLDGLPPGFFDVAINMGCLHMLSDQQHRTMHLHRVWQVLKPDGYFMVAHCRSEWLNGFYSVPDYEQVGPAVTGRVLPRRIRLKDGGETWLDLPTTHFREAGEQELAEELTAAGFEVVRTLDQDNEAFGNTAVLISRKP